MAPKAAAWAVQRGLEPSATLEERQLGQRVTREPPGPPCGLVATEVGAEDVAVSAAAHDGHGELPAAHARGAGAQAAHDGRAGGRLPRAALGAPLGATDHGQSVEAPEISGETGLDVGSKDDDGP